MSRIRLFLSQPKLLLFMLPGMLLGITLHEWGHAFAAWKLGDPTARNFGRLSLNPIDHFDPIGFLCLLLIGFGWAKPVPVNPRNFKKPRRDELIVSIAGIAMNILEILVFSVVFALLVKWKRSLFYNEVLYNCFLYLISINASLAMFNLIPLPPLDGSHILECLLGRHMNYNFRLFLYKYGQIILLALLWLGVLDYPLSWAQSTAFRFVNFLLRVF